MARVLTDNKYYSQIADVIREQNGTSNTYKPQQMVNALKDLFYEEVEGVPPITFQGIGENLLDYRIDGASGGVGERTKNLCTNKNMVVGLYSAGAMVSSNLFITSDFIPVEYGKTYTASLFDLDENRVNNMVYEKINANKEWIGQNSTDKSITINDENIAYLRIRNFAANSQYITNNNYKYQLEEGSTATDYEPYGYKVPVVVSGENLFDEENAVDTDYYITNAGQENAGANGDRFLQSYINVKPSTQYTFKWSQTIMGSDDNTPYIRISEYTSNNTFIQRLLCQCSAQSQNKYTFTTSNNTLYIDIRIDSETSTRGQHITEVMLVKGATAPDTYEEYTATTTNIYLDEPIEENESISLSDTNVNIPTIRGTNVLTVDTTVQPSNVYVKARKESQYETIMRERYEEAQAQLDALESGGE